VRRLPLAKPRENEVTISDECRRKLIEFRTHSSLNQKGIAAKVGVSVRWLHKLKDQQNKHFGRKQMLAMCKVANVEYEPALVMSQDEWDWVPGTKEHLRWVCSVTPKVYGKNHTPLKTKLFWLKHHSLNHRAILHQGNICGICECLSLTDGAIQMMIDGKLTENHLTRRAFFPDEPWPAAHLLIQNYMILDPTTLYAEQLPGALKSVVKNLPLLLEEAFSGKPDGAWLYASPAHFHEHSKEHPPGSARLLICLGFEQISCHTSNVFRASAPVTLEKLAQMALDYRWD